jgi:hypothetical protein
MTVAGLALITVLVAAKLRTPLKSLEIYPPVDEDHAFFLQSLLLSLRIRIGQLPLGIDHPVPWQSGTLRQACKDTADQTRLLRHTGKIGHLSVGAYLAARNCIHDLPDLLPGFLDTIGHKMFFFSTLVLTLLTESISLALLHGEC